MNKAISKRWLKNRLAATVTVATCLIIGLSTVALNAQDTSDESEKKNNQIKAEVVDGKVVITTADGQTHAIDLDEVEGANGVIIQSQMRTENGKTSGGSRAILVGPGGKNHQLIFDDAFGDAAKQNFFPELNLAWSGDIQGLANVQAIQLDNSFFIGVNCQEVSEAMKAQMDLHNGLVIEIVHDDSPAASAGIQDHDILIRADKEPLIGVQDLTAVIQKAGKEEASIDLVLVRKGDEQTVTVTPEKRSDSMLEVDGDVQRIQFDVNNLPEGGVRFHRVLPGLIRQGDDVIFQAQDLADMDSMAKEMAELRKQVEQLREEMRKDK